MLFEAKNGARILERIQVDEVEAIKKFPDINHVLVIVRIEEDYLLGWHKWRSDWETFGGIIEKGESLRECIKRECAEELGIIGETFEYLGIIHYFMPPGYWNKEWHEEFGGLYGITLSKKDISFMESLRQDRDEIGAIELYSILKRNRENIDEINEKLLEFY